MGITTKAERKAEQPLSIPARTPIKDLLLDSLENQPDCEAVEYVQEVDLATRKSVRFESNDRIHIIWCRKVDSSEKKAEVQRSAS